MAVEGVASAVAGVLGLLGKWSEFIFDKKYDDDNNCHVFTAYNYKWCQQLNINHNQSGLEMVGN